MPFDTYRLERYLKSVSNRGSVVRLAVGVQSGQVIYRDRLAFHPENWSPPRVTGQSHLVGLLNRVSRYSW